MSKYKQKILSTGVHNTVIALNKTEAAKLFTGDTRSDIGSETDKMKFANKINDLVVKFIRLDFDEENDCEMLVMERLYPLDYRSYEIEKRELWFDVFIQELKQLHKNGFVHRDLKSSSTESGFSYDNIFLTEKGIRLIDVGISALKHQVNETLFNRFIEQELKVAEEFKEYFLNR